MNGWLVGRGGRLVGWMDAWSVGLLVGYRSGGWLVASRSNGSSLLVD